MKTLVTGATGFLGAAITSRLISENVRVRAIRRETSRMDLLGEFTDAVEWVQADILDPVSLEAAFDGISTTYHCAAHIGFDGRRDVEKFSQVNVTGTGNVVDAALSAGVNRLVHTSSIAALGKSMIASECIDETSECRPSSIESEYGKSKYRAELEIQRGIAEGLDAVIVNPSIIMGCGRPGENTMLLVENIRSNGIPFVPSGATNVVDVLDVVDGHLRAMESGLTGERYVLAGDNLSWKEVFETLAGALGVRPPTRSLPLAFSMPIARILELSARISGKRPIVTSESLRLATASFCYNNARAVKDLGCAFRPFTETAQRIAASLETGVQ